MPDKKKKKWSKGSIRIRFTLDDPDDFIVIAGDEDPPPLTKPQIDKQGEDKPS